MAERNAIIVTLVVAFIAVIGVSVPLFLPLAMDNLSHFLSTKRHFRNFVTVCRIGRADPST